MVEVDLQVGGSVRIGKDIRVQICQLFLRAHDCDVRIGIVAPRNVRVDREEIWKMRQERERREKEQRIGTASSKGPPRRR